MRSSDKRQVLDRLAKVGPKAVAAAEGRRLGEQADSPETPLLSISSVAELLGLPKASVRAVLASEQFAGRVQSKTAGANGSRPARVPRELMEEIRAAALAIAGDAGQTAPIAQAETVAPHPDAADAEEAAGQSEPGPTPESVSVVGPAPAPGAMSVSFAFERLLTEKDARIDDLRAEIEHLRSVLEREQSAHARTQALLSLQAPSPPEEAAEPASAAADDLSEPASAKPKRPFWKLW